MEKIFVDLDLCLACNSCEIACASNRFSESKDFMQSLQEEVRPEPRVRVRSYHNYSLPVQCRHCEDAECIDVCPTGALYRDKDSQKVFIDEKKCISCGMCVMVCPFGAIRLNEDLNLAFKCDACNHMEYPYCVEACPVSALIYTSEDEFSNYCQERKNISENLQSEINNLKGGKQ